MCKKLTSDCEKKKLKIYFDEEHIINLNYSYIIISKWSSIIIKYIFIFHIWIFIYNFYFSKSMKFQIINWKINNKWSIILRQNLSQRAIDDYIKNIYHLNLLMLNCIQISRNNWILTGHNEFRNLLIFETLSGVQIYITRRIKCQKRLFFFRFTDYF